jgi:hypothetical protein
MMDAGEVRTHRCASDVVERRHQGAPCCFRHQRPKGREHKRARRALARSFLGSRRGRRLLLVNMVVSVRMFLSIGARGRENYEFAKHERFLLREDRTFLKLASSPHAPLVKR